MKCSKLGKFQKFRKLPCWPNTPIECFIYTFSCLLSPIDNRWQKNVRRKYRWITLCLTKQNLLFQKKRKGLFSIFKTFNKFCDHLIKLTTANNRLIIFCEIWYFAKSAKFSVFCEIDFLIFCEISFEKRGKKISCLIKYKMRNTLPVVHFLSVWLWVLA